MDNVLHPNIQDPIKKLDSLLKDIQTAMLTTIDLKGNLHSRPMVTQQIDANGDLWFFTAEKSPITFELEKNQKVHLNYVRPDKNEYVAISGECEIVRDSSKVKELWSPSLIAWFPKGLEDPSILLLRVQIIDAEYWQTPSSTVVKLIGLAKATITGKTHEGELVHHEKINFAS